MKRIRRSPGGKVSKQFRESSKHGLRVSTRYHSVQILSHIIDRHWDCLVFVPTIIGNGYIPAHDKITGFKE